MFNITLTWNRPDPPNGVIIQYNVSGTTYSYRLDNVLLSQVSYTAGTRSTFAILNTAQSNDVTSSYTWIDLVRGKYQFSVVAFTSEGPGIAASEDVDVSVPSSELII